MANSCTEFLSNSYFSKLLRVCSCIERMAPCKERDATMPLDDGEVGEIVQGGIQVGIGVSSSDWLQKYVSSSISIEVCRWQVSFPLRNAKV